VTVIFGPQCTYIEVFYLVCIKPATGQNLEDTLIIGGVDCLCFLLNSRPVWAFCAVVKPGH